MTEPALLLAPLACAVVLVLSGLAKYGDPSATRAAFESMRVPKALSTTTVVRLLPAAEIVAGLLLLVTWGWALVLVGAVVTSLFSAYWVLVLLVLRRGEEVDCGCFGATGDDRVTGTTLTRNTLLVGLAALATAFGAAGEGLLPALGDLDDGDVGWLVMAAAVTALAVLVVGRRQPSEDVVDEELLDYERAPIPFALLRDADGDTKTLRELAAERPQLLLLMSPSCGACHDVAARVPGWLPRLGPVEVQLVFADPPEWLPAEVTPPGAKVWFDVEGGAGYAFAAGRPSAVLLGADGMLAGGPVAGTTAITGFVEEVIQEIEGAEYPAPSVVVAPEHGHHHGHDHVADRSS